MVKVQEFDPNNDNKLINLEIIFVVGKYNSFDQIILQLQIHPIMHPTHSCKDTSSNTGSRNNFILIKKASHFCSGA